MAVDIENSPKISHFFKLPDGSVGPLLDAASRKSLFEGKICVNVIFLTALILYKSKNLKGSIIFSVLNFDDVVYKSAITIIY